MSEYDIRIIRLMFKICYYYVMSFLVIPITFTSDVLKLVHLKSGNNDSHSGSTHTYQDLVKANIIELRKVLVKNSKNSKKSMNMNSDLDSDMDLSKHISESGNSSSNFNANNMSTNQSCTICDRCRCNSIFSMDEALDKSLERQSDFELNNKIYSIKVDTIGKYDLCKSDVKTDAHIHINLKRKTIDVVGMTGTNRLPLRSNQIIVSD